MAHAPRPNEKSDCHHAQCNGNFCRGRKLEHKSSETNASRGAGQSRVAHLGGETCWRAERKFHESICHFAGVDWLEAEPDRHRNDRQLGHLPRRNLA